MFRTWPFKNLGYCERCVKKAFMAATAAWITVGLLFVLGESRLLIPGLIAAALLTVLWIAHVGAFAFRSTKGTASLSNTRFSRRRFISVFLKTTGVAVAVSIPMKAHAWSACGGWNGECHPCARKYTATDSNCYSCRSCGDKCGDGQC